MKKQVKKIVSLLVTAALLMSLGLFACGASPQETAPAGARFVAISDCGRLLELSNALGKMYCSGYTDTYSDYYAAVVVELQLKNGSSWDTIETWSSSPDSSSTEVDLYHYVERGTYQLKVTHKAYTKSYVLAEQFISYSDEVTY